jgi:hypothetical protein
VSNKRYILAAVLTVLATAAAARAAAPAAPAGAVQQVLAEYQQGRWQQAATDGATLAAAQPRAWVITAAALEQLGQYAAAAQAYSAYAATAPDDSVRAYVQESISRCQEAQAAVCPTCPSADLDAAARLRLAACDAAPAVRVSEHFEVHCPSAELASLLGDLAEKALRRVTSVVLQDAAYPHSVIIEVHRTPQEYAAGAAATQPWSGGRFELTVDAAGNVRRVIHLVQLDAAGNFDPAILDRVLPHELCHLVLTEWFGEQTCPLYLQEGLAVLSEFCEQDDRIILAGASLATGQDAALEWLTTRETYNGQELPLFYAQSYSLMSYLHERLTRGQFSGLLTQIRAGCTLEEALQRTLAVAPQDGFADALAQAWQDHAVAHAQFLLTLRTLATPCAPAPAPAAQE